MYKITNKTGMRVRYAKIKFEPKESKILDLDSKIIYEHEYFKVEELNKKKLNEKSEKQKRKIK